MCTPSTSRDVCIILDLTDKMAAPNFGASDARSGGMLPDCFLFGTARLRVRGQRNRRNCNFRRSKRVLLVERGW